MRFIVVSHKKVFLVCSVPVCACHISRYCNCASFFNTIKAEIESIFKSPANCRYNPNTFICQVCTYPSVAKGVIPLHIFVHFNSCYDFDLSDVSNKDLGKEKASEHSCSEVMADYINLSSHGRICFANLHLKDLTERCYGFNCIINP